MQTYHEAKYFKLIKCFGNYFPIPGLPPQEKDQDEVIYEEVLNPCL
jgi:hypothetical protein